MPGPDYSFLTPRAEDGPAVLQLAARIENFTPEDVAIVKELWEESLQPKNEPDRYHFLIARSAAQIMGFVAYGHHPLTRGVYDLYWLAVDPQNRHSGVGRALVAQVEKIVLSRGGYLLMIETSSVDAFSTTRKFYLSCGYQVAATIPHFYQPGDDLVIYTKQLQVPA